MDEEGKFWFRLWASVILGVTIIACTGMAYHHFNLMAAFENGYERDTLKGSATTHWVKTKDTENSDD